MQLFLNLLSEQKYKILVLINSIIINKPISKRIIKVYTSKDYQNIVLSI